MSPANSTRFFLRYRSTQIIAFKFEFKLEVGHIYVFSRKKLCKINFFLFQTIKQPSYFIFCIKATVSQTNSQFKNKKQKQIMFKLQAPNRIN